MGPPKPADTATGIDAMMEIVAQVEAACADDPRMAGAELDEVLRHVPGKRAVLTGHWQGRPAVFRVFAGDDPAAAVREWEELQRAWPSMQSGAFRIAQPLYFARDHSILVVEHVPGTPLMEAIWQAEPDARARWLAPAAGWLRAYTAMTEEQVPPRASSWLARAADAAVRQPHKKLLRREARVLTSLHRIAPRFEAPWRHAICHGDFHPNNLIADGERLTGIDTGGSASMPILKDIARFLMHMGRRGLIPSGQRRFGVDAKGIDAFAEAFDMSLEERELALPFMLGCEALLRVEHAGMKRGRIRRAAEMTEALAEDLEQL